MAEALIAGALLGLAQGVLFYIVQRLLLMGAAAPPDEVQKALLLSFGILVFGTLFNGMFSMATAAIRNKRRVR